MRVLLINQWKEILRSSIWRQNFAINIFFALFVLVMMLYMLVLGLFLDETLLKLFPNSDPLDKFNSLLLYYFAISFILGVLMQKIPTFSIYPYLHLPISKKKIIHFLLSKSTLNIFNLLPLFVFIPFTILRVHSFLWLTFNVLILLATNYFTVYIKRQMSSNVKVVLFSVLFIVVVGVLDFFQIFSLSYYSQQFFSLVFKSSVYIVVPIILLVISYLLNYDFLKDNIYLDNTIDDSRIETIVGLNYLHSMGQVGELIILEIKLILRHKRTKSLLVMMIFFILYGLLFYNNEKYMEGFNFLIFAGIFMSGGFMFSYGNYLISWDSSHFDKILSSNIDFFNFFKAKHLLLIAISTITFILTLPYFFYGTKIILINIASLIFNIGISSQILLYFSLRNTKRIDLNKRAAFNWQGVDTRNFMKIGPILVGPILVQLPFNFFNVPWLGIALITLIGFVGIIFRNRLLQFTVVGFKRRKYILADAFRQD